MALPLHERARSASDDPIVRLSDGSLATAALLDPLLLPDRPLAEGEQYRFHFDMTRCIGCRSCEVACNEQNGNPEEIRWRRIGEIEGGTYPDTQRLYLSMGCNHCMEPDCLKGCPVEAYTKDPVTGIVLHSADMCIGCQYCTWNCPYCVPQYNPDRGVVGKCDMCYGRLTDGLEPACVNACPEAAIQIEIVNTIDWKQNHQSGDSPGMPSAGQTISTTRITLPPNPQAFLANANANRVIPEHPHWPLVFMTVLMQMVMGALVLVAPSRQPQPVIMSCLLGIVGVALTLSTLHLGRPAFAWRALKMWRRSWLSREIVMFSLFAGALTATTAVHWLLATDSMPRYSSLLWHLLPVLNWTSLGLAILGTLASSFIYLIQARPSWNTVHTPLDFLLTGMLSGALFVRIPAISALLPSSHLAPITSFLYLAAALWIANFAIRIFRLRKSASFERRATVKLLVGVLRKELFAGVLPVFAGLWLAAIGNAPMAFLVALFGLFVVRYLFFVSVVPLNMALTFLNSEASA